MQGSLLQFVPPTNQAEATARGTTPRTSRSILVLGAVGALVVVLGAAMSWWHLIGISEPGYIKVVRIGVLIAGVLAFIGVFLAQRRTGFWLFAGIWAIAVPLLTIVMLTTLDGSSMSNAVFQAKQARRLMDGVEYADRSLEASWFQSRNFAVAALLRDDYTIFDGMETGLFFAHAGWYLTVVGGILLLVAAWGSNENRCRDLLVRYRVHFLITCAILICINAIPLGIGHYYWNRARAYQATTRYADALASYHTAARWDRRMRYDVMYHFELGRLYGAMGQTQQPDYQALLGDMYFQAGMDREGYNLYRREIASVPSEPILRARYANAILQMACDDYSVGRTQSAIDKFLRAHELDPNSLEINYGLGLAYTKLGNYTRAVDYWKTLIDNADNIGIYHNKYISSYTFTKPLVARSWGYLGWCYYNLHDYSRAQMCDFAAHNMGSSLHLID